MSRGDVTRAPDARGRTGAKPHSSSLRSKFLLIVLGGGVLPLSLTGLWLARSTKRSGEAILRARLDAALVRAAQEIGNQWVGRRSLLLSIGDGTTLRSILRDLNAGLADAIDAVDLAGSSAGRAAGFDELRQATQLVIVSDARSEPRWVLDFDSAGSPVLVSAADSLRIGGRLPSDVVPIRLAIENASGTEILGEIEARFRAPSLVPAIAGSAASGGAIFGIVNRATGVVVSPLPFDADLLQRDRFTWGGEEWLASSRTLDDPAIEVLAAMPASSFTLPFEAAARRGIIALIVVTVTGFGVTVLLTRRVTRSLEQLADAAEAVTRGNLDRRVEAGSGDEVGRLGEAFNVMTDSLRRTLGELSQRQAVAAVGEFASALAHEIRNPLSAIRLHLQHIEERVAGTDSLGEPVRQVLRDVNRLDQTVAGALRMARTGAMVMETVSLRVPLEAAVRGAAAEFAKRGVRLEPLPAACDATMRGNSAALEQLFLNLLLNAAQASSAGAEVALECETTDSQCIVAVRDSGSGLTDEQRERAFQPFYTTKPEGTGLGLTVAKRIVAAHGGAIEIDSAADRGTRVQVHLPITNPAAGNTDV